jgi:hypothetical protein
MYGYDHPTDPIGPEPSCDSPGKRAAWHAGMQALGSVDGPDIRGVPDGWLWVMRDTYEAETALAPRYVTDELRQVRLGAEDARLTSVRADAEAEQPAVCPLRRRPQHRGWLGLPGPHAPGSDENRPAPLARHHRPTRQRDNHSLLCV